MYSYADEKLNLVFKKNMTPYKTKCSFCPYAIDVKMGAHRDI